MGDPVVIVGGGPAGTSTALCLREAGLDSVIVERDDFPRFHIGEAITGSAGKLLRRLGLGDALLAQGHAVKRGAFVVGTNGKNAFRVPAVDVLEDGTRQETWTWQLWRQDFDKLLLDTAVERGAQLVHATAEDVTRGSDGRVDGVVVRHRDGGRATIRAAAVVDAAGPRCFLHRLGLTSEKERGKYDAQIAVYGHLVGADRDPDGTIGDDRNDTVMLYTSQLHWAWFIPVRDDIVSVGIVVPTSTYRAARQSPTEFFLSQLETMNPALAARTRQATLLRPVETCANYSYRIREFAGNGWLCVGDSHRFVDPFFAFGVHHALFEGRMAADALARYVANGRVEELLDYQQRADDAQDIVQDLVDAFWNAPLAFGYLITKKHRDDIIDIFAGRIYDLDEPSPGLAALRRINASALMAGAPT